MIEKTPIEQPINQSLPIKEIGEGAKQQLILTSTECDELAKTLDVLKLASFSCETKLSPKAGQKFRLEGKIHANYQRQSALSLETVDLEIEEEFTTEFHPLHQKEGRQADELDLEFEEEMVEYYEGDSLDIGQVIYEQFVISLEEFPKKEGETFQWTDETAGAKDNPFAKLSALKTKPE